MCAVRTGPVFRVYTIGFFVAALATLVAVFVLSLVRAVIDELAMGDFGSAAYIAIATFFVGGGASLLMWRAWSRFARYAHKEIGLELPGFKDT